MSDDTKDFNPREDPEWISVGTFPSNFKSIQPFGAQFVGPSFGHNERYLKYEKLIAFLLEKDIPFHTQDVATSMFNAVEVFVPREFEALSKAALTSAVD